MSKQKEKKKGKTKSQAPETGKLTGAGGLLKYLRELSVVVIGVAITFIGSNWINSCQKENELKRHLEAVRIELKEDLGVIKEKGLFYQRQGRLAKYLMSDAPENLNRDRIDSLNIHESYSIFGYFFTLIYKDSAFEMLKNSESLNRIRNKELSRSILDCYALMENAKSQSDAYINRKMNELYGAILDNQQLFYGDVLNPKFRRVYYFFMVYIDLDKLFEECEDQIEETLALLEKR